MSHYVVHRPTAALGAISFDGGIDDLAGRVAEVVTNRVSIELARGIDRGVERMSTAAGAGLDRFLDSPAGEAVLDKLENKLSNVVVNTANKHQTNLALLGVAGAAIVMGSVYVGTKMSSRAAALSFLVGGIAVGLVATGVFSPPDETKLPASPPVRRIPGR